MNYITHPDCEVKHEAVFASVCGYCKAVKRLIEQDKLIATLEAALREIEEHPHCGAECWRDPTGNISMEMGHTLGHRCAAEIARKALEGK